MRDQVFNRNQFSFMQKGPHREIETKFNRIEAGYQLPHQIPVKRCPLSETSYKGWVDTFYPDYLTVYNKEYPNTKDKWPEWPGSIKAVILQSSGRIAEKEVGDIDYVRSPFLDPPLLRDKDLDTTNYHDKLAIVQAQRNKNVKHAWGEPTKSDLQLARASYDPETARYENQYGSDPRLSEAWVEVRNDLSDRWQNITKPNRNRGYTHNSRMWSTSDALDPSPWKRTMPEKQKFFEAAKHKRNYDYIDYLPNKVMWEPDPEEKKPTKPFRPCHIYEDPERSFSIRPHRVPDWRNWQLKCQKKRSIIGD